MRINTSNILFATIPAPTRFFLNHFFGRKVIPGFTHDLYTPSKRTSSMEAPINSNLRKRKVEALDSHQCRPPLKKTKTNDSEERKETSELTNQKAFKRKNKKTSLRKNIPQSRPKTNRQLGIEKMEELLQPHNMRIIKSVANGDCMFNSVFDSGKCSPKKVMELRIKVHNSIKEFIEGRCPEEKRKKIEAALGEVVKNSMRCQLRFNSKLNFYEAENLLNEMIEIEKESSDTFNNLKERIEKGTLLKMGTYMEPAEVIFLAIELKQPIALFDIDGYPLIIINQEGKLYNQKIETLADRFQLPKDTRYMFYDFDYQHFWGAREVS